MTKLKLTELFCTIIFAAYLILVSALTAVVLYVSHISCSSSNLRRETNSSTHDVIELDTFHQFSDPSQM